MEQIKAILREELNNSISMQQKFEQSLHNLPKGSIVEKEIGNHLYHYRAYREGGKVKFEYLGKLSARELQVLHSKQKSRKQISQSIRDLKKQIAFLERALNEK
ncbi:MAG: hypothetical protein R3A45_06240 [Bdellovibrionota bacterium]